MRARRAPTRPDALWSSRSSGVSGPMRAPADRAQLFASFATESFNEIDNAVTALAASGDEKAQTLLSALADRRLFYSPADKHIVLKDESGKSFDALTGAALAAFPGGLKPVRINNRVRSTIDAALGSLTLMARRSRRSGAKPPKPYSNPATPRRSAQSRRRLPRRPTRR